MSHDAQADEASSALIARLLQEDQYSAVEEPANSFLPSPEQSEDSDDDFLPEHLLRKAKKAQRKLEAPSKPPRKKVKATSTSASNPSSSAQKAPISLQTLLEKDIIKPGENLLTIEYMGNIFVGSLRKDGQIVHTRSPEGKGPASGSLFVSLSSWSISCKRQITPSRMADDGWHSVKYASVPLCKFKEKLLNLGEQNLESAINKEDGANNELNMPLSSPPKEPRTQEPSLPTKVESQKNSKSKKKPIREADLHVSLAENSTTQQKVAKEYSKDRLRPSKPSVLYRAIEAGMSPHTMIKCDDFLPNEQPFKVTISSNALFIMDLHAHLAHTEIIGYLAGQWRPQLKELVVFGAFPCRSLESHDHSQPEQDLAEMDRGTNVEMDPESEMDVRAAIFDQSLSIVGWYHSHPVFQPDPSIRDIENQRSYQQLFQCENTKLYPFVGMIVGPYDLRMNSSESIIRCFVVDPPVHPMVMPFQIKNESSILSCKDQVQALIDRYKHYAHRVYWDDVWKTIPKREKLKQSLLSHLSKPPTQEELDFVTQTVQAV